MVEYLSAIAWLHIIYNLLFSQNIFMEVSSKEQDVWYNSVLISSLLSFALGVILTFIGEYIILNHKERKEMEKYEYYLLSTTLDFLVGIKEVSNHTEVEIMKENLRKFLKDLSSDIRFFKLDSSQNIIDALKKGYQNEDFSKEIVMINERRNELKK